MGVVRRILGGIGRRLVDMSETNGVELACNRLDLSFNDHAQEGLGEDADPVVLSAGPSGAIAVFDGLGGAGAATYNIGEETRRGAYIASRAAADEFSKFAGSLLELTDGKFLPEFFSDQEASYNRMLHQCLAGHLASEASKLVPKANDGSEGKLQSKMIRNLPTTMAGAFYMLRSRHVDICCVWAGDSRCYMLTPTKGLQQLTEDDQKHPSDALSSLVEDTVMSNCLNAGNDFVLNRKPLPDLVGPLVLFSATDGCFQYLLSPWHFEDLLLGSLEVSDSVQEWRDEIRRRISIDRGDDASMALVALGWPNMDQLKESFRARTELLAGKFVCPVNAARNGMSPTDCDPATPANPDFAEIRRALWAEYKPTYSEYLHYPKGGEGI